VLTLGAAIGTRLVATGAVAGVEIGYGMNAGSAD
jgi:hypothetical protein